MKRKRFTEEQDHHHPPGERGGPAGARTSAQGQVPVLLRLRRCLPIKQRVAVAGWSGADVC
jgi:hypothetical protein